MTLGELIAYLSALPQDSVFPMGLFHPHSYRGYYEQLAFEIFPFSRVSDMLGCAQECIGQSFTGYKGGNYIMGLSTPVWIAPHGYSSAIPITQEVLETLRNLPFSEPEW